MPKRATFKNSDYPSIYIAVLLDVHVFDCDVTGVPCEGAVCECDYYLHFGILLCQCTKILGYASMKLKTTFSDYIFTVPYTLS